MFIRTLFLFLVGFTGLCFGQDRARMDQVVQTFVTDGWFMGSVLVARGDDLILNKGYGSANLENDVPNDPDTKFRLGSLTKQFTAAAILLLEERGKIKLDEPVKTYLPNTPAAWDKVTIFHLLTHTSGIPNFTSFPDYLEHESHAFTPEKIINLFRDKPLDFEPGSKMSYTNSGYIVLGALIEILSGESYANFLQKNIFTPLEMKNSGYDSNSDVIKHRASGYRPSDQGFKNASFVHMSIPFSAGALYSTTGDLLRWERGLLGGKLLTAASLEKMTTPFKNGYAFGVGVATRNGRKLIAHNGGISGFNTYLGYYPESQTTIVVLSNVNGNVPDKLGVMLGNLAHGEDVVLQSERKIIPLPAATLQKYVGVFQVAPGRTITLTLEGDKLMAQASGAPKVQVFPESETQFFSKVIDAQLEFIRDANGAINSGVLHQSGRDRAFTRNE